MMVPNPYPYRAAREGLNVPPASPPPLPSYYRVLDIAGSPICGATKYAGVKQAIRSRPRGTEFMVEHWLIRNGVIKLVKVEKMWRDMGGTFRCGPAGP